MPVSKDIPAPVRAAQAVLDSLRPDIRAGFAEILPSFAMTLARAGQSVSEEILREHLVRGAAHMESESARLRRDARTAAVPPRSYDDIVGRLSPAKENKDPITLIDAGAAGDLERVKCLYENGADIRVHKDLALCWAARNGHLEVVKYLHERGADIQADNDMALRWAAENGHLEVVKYLHERGADIRAYNDWALRWAAENGHLEVVKCLHERGADIRAENDWALCGAAGNGHLEVVKYLHERGADIRAYDDLALRGAAGSGHPEVVKYLHERGADIRADNDRALYSAAGSGHLEVVKCLHERGADIRAQNDRALCSAAGSGHLEVVKYLHERGADIRVCNDRALRWAADNGHLKVVKYLHEKGGVPLTVIWDAQQEKCRRGFASLRQWELLRGVDSCPDGLEMKSPRLFRRDAFHAVKDMLKKEGYTGREANRYAFAASALFRTADRVLDFLEKWGAPGKQPLHDIVHAIEIPTGSFDVAAWGDAVLKHGPEMAKLVKFAHKMPQPEKDGSGGWSCRGTKQKIAQFAFKNGAQNPALAALCLEYAWDDDDFEDTLKVLNAYQKKYAANDNKKPDRIPAMDIDGATFGKPDYHLYKLPDGDLRGLFLGEFTNCCQHMAGEGSECAEHGFLSPHGGFYVAEHKQTNQIIAQAWAWRGTKGELVLDSLESLGGHFNERSWGAALKQMAEVIKKHKDITAFHVGKGGATPDRLSPFHTAQSPAKPKDYSGYRDSSSQFKIT